MTLWIMVLFLTTSSTYSASNMMAYPQIFTSEAACLNRVLSVALPENYAADCVPVYKNDLKPLE